MEAFDFINDIALWFGDFVPDWDLLPPNEGGVKFKPGGKIEILKPGHLYMYWPVTTKVVTMPIKRQTIKFGQRLTTADDISVQVYTTVVFTVDDVIKALVETDDFDDTVAEVGEKISVKPIMSRDFEQVRKDMAESNDMRNEVTRNARSILSDFGLTVLDAFISDMTETKVFSHEGEGLAIAYDGDDDE